MLRFQTSRLVHTAAVMALAVFTLPALAADKGANDSQAIGVEGTVMNIQPAQHELTIQTTDGQALKVQVGNDSYVQLEGPRQGTLSDLKKGEMVSIIYYKQNGQNKAGMVSEGRGGAGEIKRQPR